MSERESFSLSVLTTRADEFRAELRVRVHGSGVPQEGVRPALAGHLTGPCRGRDTTLPMRVPLVACADAAATARATFTEPAFWTPDMPNLYRLEARLLDGGRTVAEFEGMVGLRRLGVRGRSFWLDGRRWVPRGVSAVADGFTPQLFRDIHAAVECRTPESSLLAAADEAGVAIVARLEDSLGNPVDGDDAARRIASWSLHPAVVITVVPRTMPATAAAEVAVAARTVKGTMLVGLEVDGLQPPETVDATLITAFDCLVVDLPGQAAPHDAWRTWPREQPLVARRRLPPADREMLEGDRGAAGRRRECDRLQAALAAWAAAGEDCRLIRDWAGYLVVAW